MKIFQSREERELEVALKDFLRAANITNVKTLIWTTENSGEVNAILSVKGKDITALRERVGQFRAALENAGIHLESEEAAFHDEEMMKIVWPEFGMPDWRSRYCEARDLSSNENGGVEELVSKLQRGTQQLLTQRSAGFSGNIERQRQSALGVDNGR